MCEGLGAVTTSDGLSCQCFESFVVTTGNDAGNADATRLVSLVVGLRPVPKMPDCKQGGVTPINVLAQDIIPLKVDFVNRIK